MVGPVEGLGGRVGHGLWHTFPFTLSVAAKPASSAGFLSFSCLRTTSFKLCMRWGLGRREVGRGGEVPPWRFAWYSL